ncbi:hypothetical protein ACFLZM_05870, partial [Thermodesulfobacteriota bacterium]
KQWKITDLSIFVPNKKDQIAYIRSFSDPAKICPAKKQVKTTKSGVSWKRVTCSEINLQIVFPDKEPKKTVKGKQYQYMLGHRTGTYMVTGWKLGQKVSKNQAEQIINNMAKKFADNMKYEITTQKTYVYDGHTGKFFTLTTGNKIIQYKSVVVGEIMYQLIISSTKQALKKELEDTFFNSFAIAKN